MIQLTLIDVAFGVNHLAERARLLTFVDKQSGIQVNIPLDPLVAAQIGGALTQVPAEENGSAIAPG